MKDNLRFFTVVAALLLIAGILLTGCMAAITRITGTTKPYQMDDPISTQPPAEDPPIPQDAMAKKFADMAVIDQDAGSITVISKDYLDNYWKDYKEGDIRSLTTEEVMYIIGDSIRLYNTYRTVVMEDYVPPFTVKDAALEAEVLQQIVYASICNDATEDYPDGVMRTMVGDAYFNEAQAQLDIYALILYRLAMLSTPDAFFTDTEVKWSLLDFTTEAKWSSLYYIPGYSAEIKREALLACFVRNPFVDSTIIPGGSDIDGNYIFTVPAEVKREDVFLLNWPSASSVSPYLYEILFLGVEAESSCRAYPTEELKAGWAADKLITLTCKSERFLHTLQLNTADCTFVYDEGTVYSSVPRPVHLEGTYEFLRDGTLRLYPPTPVYISANWYIELFRTEDGGYRYDASTGFGAAYGINLPDGAVFYVSQLQSSVQ